MRYVNARNTAYGEDRRTYKESDSGVSSTQRAFNVSYDNGRVEAYLNGVRLFPGEDYTKTPSGIGTSITLASDLGSNNVLEIVGYQGINSGNALVEDNFVVGTGSTGSGGSYTNSTTVFPVASSAGDTVSVWRNGIKLVPTTDYTVSVSAQTVTLGSAASSADEITVHVVGALIHNNLVQKENASFNSGNNAFTMPTTRGSDTYVLTRDDTIGTGGTTWKQTVVPPTITSTTYPTQNGVVATALAATGAQDTTAETFLINGQNLGTASDVPTVQIQVSGSYVAFAGTVSCNSSGTVVTCANVTKQASADNYTLRLTHGSNNLTAQTTVNFSADPSFSTASGSLGTVFTTIATSKTITAGSSVSWYEGTPTMPTWMTHFADGATGTSQDLTGTPTNTGTSEVQNFNIIIRDAENQSHNRDFSLTVSDLPTGGAVTTYTGYRVHSWTTVGTNQNGGAFVIHSATTADILIVAGGGGAGGRFHSGGGGAGGVRQLSSQALTAGTYNIIVGDGGNGGDGAGNNNGSKGNNSSVIKSDSSISLSATGGGYGAGYENDAGDGGSGGGGNGGELNNSYQGGSGNEGGYSPVEGYDGVAYPAGAGYHAGGGGGGAGAIGGNGVSNKIADGGAGISNTWRDGTSQNYGGGGVGSVGYSSIGHSGTPAATHGGGGVDTAGSTNTGGGGGAPSGTSGSGKKGGSGIVVIRYAI